MSNGCSEVMHQQNMQTLITVLLYVTTNGITGIWQCCESFTKYAQPFKAVGPIEYSGGSRI